MADLKVNNITSLDGTTGPVIAGIASVNSNSHFVVPTGRTGQRYVDDGENIVRDGLVLYLDAKYSYPGATGTNPDAYTWYDMSGNENHGELKNGVGYNAANGGSLSFDGVDDYVNTFTNIGTLNADYTIEIDFSINSFTGADMRIANAIYGDISQLTLGWVNNTFRLWLQNSWNDTNFTSDINTNYKISIVHFSTTTYLYVNGILNTTILNRSSYFNNFGLGSNFLFLYGSYFNGKVYSTRIYNRALTAQEVLQNFNATRSRYGI